MRNLRHGGSPTTGSQSPTIAGRKFISDSSNVGRSAGSGYRKSLSLSPLSSIENILSPTSSAAYSKPPVKLIEEDVFVMDGVLVASSVSAGGRVLKSLSSSDSCGSSSSSSNSSSNNRNCSFKMELCRAWEDFGRCRFGSNCQFAHGKEELHPSRLFVKTRNSEAFPCKPFSPGSFTSRFRPPANITGIPGPASPMVSPARPEYTSKTPTSSYLPEFKRKISGGIAVHEHPMLATPEFTTVNPIISADIEHYSKSDTGTSISEHSSRAFLPKATENLNRRYSMDIEAAATSCTSWSPLDDGIVSALPSQTDNYASREGVDTYIDHILYGPTPSARKRLPVFNEICLD